MALTLAAQVSSIQMRPVPGGTNTYSVQYAVVPNGSNACPAGQENQCMIRFPVTQAEAAALVVGTSVTITIA
jgi:hypothetical protein